MTSRTSIELSGTITDKYLSRTQRSRDWDLEAKCYLPGGDTRSSTHFFPYPPYMEKGEGFCLYDCDGNRYIDFLNNYTSLIHGHAYPAVVEAARDQLPKGTVYGSASGLQVELAKILCRRLPSIESLRFTNSGTEATMMAMRAARAFSGREVILKMDGGFHGTHDFAQVNVRPDLGTGSLPALHLEGAGIPACVLDKTMVVPFNDLDAVDAVLQEHHSEIAAIIVEPMLHAGGMIPPQAGYLAGLRKLADDYGVLLIFDEIVTFRLSLGGLQGLEGVEPDLTALGKIIGGGFPVGAFGGRKECMEQFDPARPPRIQHSGTFNGNSVTMAAGLVTLGNLDAPQIEKINLLGTKLRQGINQVFAEAGIRGQATGAGSLLQIHWTSAKIDSSKDASLAARLARDLPKLFHLDLVNRGIFSAPRGAFNISTPMGEDEIAQALDAVGASLEVLRPYVAEEAPHLLAK